MEKNFRHWLVERENIDAVVTVLAAPVLIGLDLTAAISTQTMMNGVLIAVAGLMFIIIRDRWHREGMRDKIVVVDGKVTVLTDDLTNLSNGFATVATTI